MVILLSFFRRQWGAPAPKGGGFSVLHLDLVGVGEGLDPVLRRGVGHQRQQNIGGVVVIPIDLVAGGGAGRDDIHVAHLAGPGLGVALVGALAGDLQLQPVAGGDDNAGGVDLDDILPDLAG